MKKIILSKSFFIVLLFLSIVFLSSGQLYAQEEEGEIIILSKKVGEVIDAEESKKFNLFPAIKGFKSTVFLKLPDGSYIFKLICLNETTGEEKVKRIPATEWDIKIYGERIDPSRKIQVESKEKIKFESKEKKKEQKVEKPPLNGGRIASELFAGVGLGVVPAVIVIVAAKSVEQSDIEERNFVYATIGYALGNTLGVYLVGDTGNETGSFKATLAGSVLGLGFGWGGTFALDNPIPIFACPIIGAVIGFNMTRRYKTPDASETALINFRDGQKSFAVPRVYFSPNPLDKGDLIQTIDLVKVRF